MINRQELLDVLSRRIVVGDGATGTNLGLSLTRDICFVELLNISNPAAVADLHLAYTAAGSMMVETNTFRANPIELDDNKEIQVSASDVIAAGVKLAKAAVPGKIWVAGAIGPLPPVEGEPLSLDEQNRIFRKMAQAHVEAGADLLIFETFTRVAELKTAVEATRQLSAEIPIIAQLAFEENARTISGDSAATAGALLLDAGADVIGANCGAGVPEMVVALQQLRRSNAPLSAFMNAGFASDVDGRRVHVATPEYLADRAVQLADLGVRIIGGCCGTGPSTIRSIRNALGHRTGEHARKLVLPPRLERAAVPPREAVAPPVPSGIIVELDPPNTGNPAAILEAAHALKEKGVETVTVADNPLASACADSVAVAGLIARETGLKTIAHLTGRDRNRIALRSSILAAQFLQLHAMLCVTGDPVRMYNETNTSGVFDVTSVGLINMASEMLRHSREEELEAHTFSLGAAFNPNVRNIQSQMDKLKRKMDAGAVFAFTQPFFDQESFLKMMDALAASNISLALFPGVLPLRSLKNALFLHNEVPGIQIPQKVFERIERFEAIADQRLAGQEIAKEYLQMFLETTGNCYLIAPRNRVDLVVPLLAE